MADGSGQFFNSFSAATHLVAKEGWLYERKPLSLASQLWAKLTTPANSSSNNASSRSSTGKGAMPRYIGLLMPIAAKDNNTHASSNTLLTTPLLALWEQRSDAKAPYGRPLSLIPLYSPQHNGNNSSPLNDRQGEEQAESIPWITIKTYEGGRATDQDNLDPRRRRKSSTMSSGQDSLNSQGMHGGQVGHGGADEGSTVFSIKANIPANGKPDGRSFKAKWILECSSREDRDLWIAAIREALEPRLPNNNIQENFEEEWDPLRDALIHWSNVPIVTAADLERMQFGKNEDTKRTSLMLQPITLQTNDKPRAKSNCLQTTVGHGINRWRRDWFGSYREAIDALRAAKRSSTMAASDREGDAVLACRLTLNRVWADFLGEAQDAVVDLLDNRMSRAFSVSCDPSVEHSHDNGLRMRFVIDYDQEQPADADHFHLLIEHVEERIQAELHALRKMESSEEGVFVVEALPHNHLVSFYPPLWTVVSYRGFLVAVYPQQMIQNRFPAITMTITASLTVTRLMP